MTKKRTDSSESRRSGGKGVLLKIIASLSGLITIVGALILLLRIFSNSTFEALLVDVDGYPAIDIQIKCEHCGDEPKKKKQGIFQINNKCNGYRFIARNMHTGQIIDVVKIERRTNQGVAKVSLCEGYLSPINPQSKKNGKLVSQTH